MGHYSDVGRQITVSLPQSHATLPLARHPSVDNVAYLVANSRTEAM